MPSSALDKVRGYVQRVRDLTPPGPTSGNSVLRGVGLLQGVFILALIDLNELVLRRAGAGSNGWWSTDTFPWVRELEAQWPTIRSEVVQYLESHAAPRTTDLIGVATGPDDATIAVPIGTGAWRTIVLRSFGRTVPGLTPHFPRTMDAISRIPARANVGFSCLDPNSSIDEHTDPNFGSLRLQLPIVIPGRPGDCCLRVGDRTVNLEEGHAIVFDLTAPHSAWNRSDDTRVLLTTEILMPAPVLPTVLNRAAQWAYGRLPSYRGLVERADAFAAIEQHGPGQ